MADGRRLLVNQTDDLQKVQFDRCLTPEKRDQHPDLAFFLIDRVDDAFEVREWSVRNLDSLPNLIVDADLGRFGLHLLEDRPDLGLLKRRRARAEADETRYPRCVPYNIPRVVVKKHLNQDIAWKDLLLHSATLAVFDFNFLLGGNDHAENLVLHLHRVDAMLQILLDLVLVARVGVNHVPVRLVHTVNCLLRLSFSHPSFLDHTVWG